MNEIFGDIFAGDYYRHRAHDEYWGKHTADTVAVNKTLLPFHRNNFHVVDGQMGEETPPDYPYTATQMQFP